MTDEERKKNAEMMHCINSVDEVIANSSDDDAGALVILFRKRIATPTNLEALLRMMDADVRTGKVRCRASSLIMTLVASMSSIYGLKMNEGSYFASCLVSCCSKSLEDEANQSKQIPHDSGCHCLDAAGRMLTAALQKVKEDPLKVLDRLTPFD
jgi:hypothetical protein